MTAERYGRNPGWIAVAVVCVVYGMLVAFGQAVLGGTETIWNAFTVWGGLACLVLFVVLMVIPYVRWVSAGRS